VADVLKMDPARIQRLRDPARLEDVDPVRILDAVAPQGDGAIVDVGAGVGFVTLPFARALPQARVVACDVLAGMLELLAEDARASGLHNVETALMPDPAHLPLGDAMAGLLVMLQVHHELDDAVALLQDCHRVLARAAPVVLVDWKDEALPGIPAGGRRVPATRIAGDLDRAGFVDVTSLDLYPCHAVLTARRP
jgi:SAM-dependent methyltransferase